MSNIQVNEVHDCRNLTCPMPIVRTKKMMDQLQTGQVIEVQATDKGSLADMQSWAKNTGHQYLGTVEDGEILKHYLRKSDPNETRDEKKYPHTVNAEELEVIISSQQGEHEITIVDGIEVGGAVTFLDFAKDTNVSLTF